MKRVLVGDVGGTKTMLAVAEATPQGVVLADARRFTSRDFSSLEALVRCYLAELPMVCTVAALAVAGPVQDGRSRTTNLPWMLDARAIESALGLRHVLLMNDLEAVGWGIPDLGDEDQEILHAGEPPSRGNACVIAAGTGLGQAGLFWDGARHHPFATEGGHADFAPGDELECALMSYLRQTHGRVSWERVLSGSGLVEIHRFLVGTSGAAVPDWLEQESTHRDPAAAIAEAAAKGRCSDCAQAMDLFLRLYGREAGNLALKTMALGGVYIAGGIAPKNLSALRASPFLDAFFSKGRMAALMKRMPVVVILTPKAPLYGAARCVVAARADQSWETIG